MSPLEIEVTREINKLFASSDNAHKAYSSTENNKEHKSSDGYKMIEGHFEIGRKLHCETYYFAKKFYQQKQNCDNMADLLLGKLRQKFEPGIPTTLVGFGSYAGLFLSLACEKNDNYNYAVLENDGDTFAFQASPNLRENIIIVLPVACTCATYFKLKKYIDNYIRDKRLINMVIRKEFINGFLIIEEKIVSKLNETLQNINDLTTEENTKNIYASCGWEKVSNDTVEFSEGQVSAYALIKLESRLYQPESCPKCFPELSKKPDEKEKFLFTTHAHYEAPNLIFNFPDFRYKPDDGRGFREVMGFDVSNENPYLFGNIVINNNSYQNYVRGNIFYNNNKGKDGKNPIIDFFNDLLSKKIEQDDKVIFITSDNKHNSFFLEDLIKAPVLQHKKVTILRYQPYQEFVDNFISIYSNLFNENIHPKTKVIYFEDVLSGGRAFKLISDYIKHSKNGDGNQTGFHLLITIIDRTTNFTKDEILRKLSTCINNEDDLISYFKLKVPIIGAAHMGDPIGEKYNLLKRLADECHLDALKVIVANDIQINKPRTLSELEKTSKKDKQRLYMPLESENRKVFEFYKELFTQEQLNHVKLFLTHEINTALSIPGTRENLAGLIENLFEKLKKPINDILTHESGKHPDLDMNLRDFIFEEKIIKNIIVSILSKPPFTYYKDIYESVFNYSVKELSENDRSDEKIKVKKMGGNDFIQLRTLIKRSIDLNSNYIISHRFLSTIKKDYLETDIRNITLEFRRKSLENKYNGEYGKVLRTNLEYKYKQLIAYNYFLLYCYKFLISRNPGRSIRLEQLLGLKDLSPETIIAGSSGDNDLPALKKLWKSPYYLFHRILKAENIYLITELKELHKSRVKDFAGRHIKLSIYEPTPEISNLSAYYFEGNKNDIIINNARKLIEKSASYGTESYQHIINSVSAMLRVTNILLLETKSETSLEIKKDVEKEAESELKKETIPGAQSRNHQTNERMLNAEIRDILDAVLEILTPGIEKEALNYAFFIEYREPQMDTYSLYPVLSKKSDDKGYDSDTVKLDKNGLIYNALYGLTDTIDGSNPQTFLFAGKLPDGSIHSFQESYFKAPELSKNGPYHATTTEYLKSKDEVYLKEKALDFQTLFENDYWNEKTETGLKRLRQSNMTLVFRLSNLLFTDDNKDDYRLKGQAVLVITNTSETTISNFKKFMNIEKIRLLLLIKEELLEYLQKQFDNDAFIEVLENRKQASYQQKLEHGLNRYLDIQNKLFDQIQYTQDAEEIKMKKKLFEIVKKAIKGQINFKYNSEPDEQYSGIDTILLRQHMSYIFEYSGLGDAKIPFGKVECIGFDLVKEIYMHTSVLDVVIPEIIINMKKYSSRLVENGLKIIYRPALKHLVFENDIREALRDMPVNHKAGGLTMCRDIMEKLQYEQFESGEDKILNIYTTTINLNLSSHGS